MAIPNWVCLDCKKEFKPLNQNGDFNFNCPKCGSPKTVRAHSISSESDSGEKSVK